MLGDRGEAGLLRGGELRSLLGRLGQRGLVLLDGVVVGGLRRLELRGSLVCHGLLRRSLGSLSGLARVAVLLGQLRPAARGLLGLLVLCHALVCPVRDPLLLPLNVLLHGPPPLPFLAVDAVVTARERHERVEELAVADGALAAEVLRAHPVEDVRKLVHERVEGLGGLFRVRGDVPHGVGVIPDVHHRLDARVALLLLLLLLHLRPELAHLVSVMPLVLQIREALQVVELAALGEGVGHVPVGADNAVGEALPVDVDLVREHLVDVGILVECAGLEHGALARLQHFVRVGKRVRVDVGPVKAVLDRVHQHLAHFDLLGLPGRHQVRTQHSYDLDHCVVQEFRARDWAVIQPAQLPRLQTDLADGSLRAQGGRVHLVVVLASQRVDVDDVVFVPGFEADAVRVHVEVVQRVLPRLRVRVVHREHAHLERGARLMPDPVRRAQRAGVRIAVTPHPPIVVGDDVEVGVKRVLAQPRQERHKEVVRPVVGGQAHEAAHGVPALGALLKRQLVGVVAQEHELPVARRQDEVGRAGIPEEVDVREARKPGLVEHHVAEEGHAEPGADCGGRHQVLVGQVVVRPVDLFAQAPLDLPARHGAHEQRVLIAVHDEDVVVRLAVDAHGLRQPGHALDHLHDRPLFEHDASAAARATGRTSEVEQLGAQLRHGARGHVAGHEKAAGQVAIVVRERVVVEQHLLPQPRLRHHARELELVDVDAQLRIPDALRMDGAPAGQLGRGAHAP